MKKITFLISVPFLILTVSCHHHHRDHDYRGNNGWHGTNPRPYYNDGRNAIKKEARHNDRPSGRGKGRKHW